VYVDGNVPQFCINAFYIDEDGKVIRNAFSTMYRIRKLWSKNRDGKITFVVGDMFVDKNQW